MPSFFYHTPFILTFSSSFYLPFLHGSSLSASLPTSIAFQHHPHPLPFPIKRLLSSLQLLFLHPPPLISLSSTAHLLCQLLYLPVSLFNTLILILSPLNVFFHLSNIFFIFLLLLLSFLPRLRHLFFNNHALCLSPSNAFCLLQWLSSPPPLHN